MHSGSAAIVEKCCIMCALAQTLAMEMLKKLQSAHKPKALLQAVTETQGHSVCVQGIARMVISRRAIKHMGSRRNFKRRLAGWKRAQSAARKRVQSRLLNARKGRNEARRARLEAHTRTSRPEPTMASGNEAWAQLTSWGICQEASRYGYDRSPAFACPYCDSARCKRLELCKYSEREVQGRLRDTWKRRHNNTVYFECTRCW